MKKWKRRKEEMKKEEETKKKKKKKKRDEEKKEWWEVGVDETELQDLAWPPPWQIFRAPRLPATAFLYDQRPSLLCHMVPRFPH